MTFWNDTGVQHELQYHISIKKAPIGGTGAGLHVLGDFIFTAAEGTITSAEALANPYDKYMTLDTGFLKASPFLKDVITDSHFYQRDRMGRSITFLARLLTDYPPTKGNRYYVKNLFVESHSFTISFPWSRS